jgi:hypothetical protein
MGRKQVASSARPFVGENVVAVPKHMAEAANETLRRTGCVARFDPKTGKGVAESERGVRELCKFLNLSNTNEYR